MIKEYLVGMTANHPNSCRWPPDLKQWPLRPIADEGRRWHVALVTLSLFFGALAAIVGWFTFRDFRRGAMEPFAKGFYGSFRRASQPKRFWAATLWNACLFGACLWGAMASAIDR